MEGRGGAGFQNVKENTIGFGEFAASLQEELYFVAVCVGGGVERTFHTALLCTIP